MLSNLEMQDAYEKHYDSLCRFATQRGVSDFEDIVQQAYVDLYQYKERIQSIRPFLFKAVLARSLNAVRDRRRRIAHNAEMASPALDTQDAPYIVQERESQSKLRAAFDRLSDDERGAIKAIHMDQLSYAEAASKLGRNPSAISMSITRAKRKLEQALA